MLDGGDAASVPEPSRLDQAGSRVSTCCWFASAWRNSAVSAPKSRKAIASSALSSLSPKEWISGARPSCCAEAAASVPCSAASCVIEDQVSCLALIVSCVESSALTRFAP